MFLTTYLPRGWQERARVWVTYKDMQMWFYTWWYIISILHVRKGFSDGNPVLLRLMVSWGNFLNKMIVNVFRVLKNGCWKKGVAFCNEDRPMCRTITINLCICEDPYPSRLSDGKERPTWPWICPAESCGKQSNEQSFISDTALCSSMFTCNLLSFFWIFLLTVHY